MNYRETYMPGLADAAHVEKDGDNWTLVLVKDLKHAPEKVWDAITDPTQLREWAPFDADKNLGSVGPVQLSTVGMGNTQTSETEVTRADPPNLLEYKWGDQNLRWQLEVSGEGTRLTLWHNINRNFISMGAAGWHICLDVLASTLDEEPIGRIVAGDALQFEGWQRLNKEYAEQFGVKPPSW